MKLPDESPVPIIDAFLQLHEGAEAHNIPMMPREALRDGESLSLWPSSDMVGYLFKRDPALTERNHIASNLDLWIKNLDQWNIAIAGVPIEASESDEHFDRLSEHADRMFLILRVDPHSGMEGVKRISELASQYPMIKSVSLTPFQIYPQIAPNSKEYYPIYAKCCELDLAVNINVGFPGPRVPAWMQD